MENVVSILKYFEQSSVSRLALLLILTLIYPTYLLLKKEGLVHIENETIFILILIFSIIAGIFLLAEVIAISVVVFITFYKFCLNWINGVKKAKEPSNPYEGKFSESEMKIIDKFIERGSCVINGEESEGHIIYETAFRSLVHRNLITYEIDTDNHFQLNEDIYLYFLNKRNNKQSNK